MSVSRNSAVGVNYFIAEVMPMLPGADESILRQVINNVARDFYKRTASWFGTFDISGQSIPGGATSMSILDALNSASALSAEHTYADVYRVPTMWVDGTQIFSQASADESLDADKAVDAVKHGVGFYSEAPGVVRFTPLIKTTYTPSVFKVKVVFIPQVSVANQPVTLSPAQSDDELPFVAYGEHSDAIVEGIMHKMTMHKGKPYSDLVASKMHGVTYSNLISQYRDEARKLYAFNVPEQIPIPFFG